MFVLHSGDDRRGVKYGEGRKASGRGKEMALCVAINCRFHLNIACIMRCQPLDKQFHSFIIPSCSPCRKLFNNAVSDTNTNVGIIKILHLSNR